MLDTMTLGLLLFLSPSAETDARAVAIAGELMRALGGEKNWREARFLRFTSVRRAQSLTVTWDRYTGRYRLDARNEAGLPFTVLMNLKTQQGRVYVAGKELSGRERSDYLNRAIRTWAGRSYWLLMPLKLGDPGVVLTYDGEESFGAVVYDKLHVRFEDVGITPGDEYWAYINRDTHLMDRWKFKLEGGAEGEYRWSGWERYGGVLMATTREGRGEVLRFEDILVTDSMPDDVFSSPEPVELP